LVTIASPSISQDLTLSEPIPSVIAGKRSVKSLPFRVAAGPRARQGAHAEAVVLDLVNPAGSDGGFFVGEGRHGSMKPGGIGLRNMYSEIGIGRRIATERKGPKR